MSTDETSDNGASSAFVFPNHPQEAVVRLTIEVKAGEGDELLLSALMTPGGQAWRVEDVETLFRCAQAAPQLGTYVFETTADRTRFVSGPTEVSRTDVRNLVFFLSEEMRQWRDQFVQMLEAFPTQELINDAALRIVRQIICGSLERSPFEITPVVDARTVEVQAVDSIDHGFNLDSLPWLAEFLESFLGGNVDTHDQITKVGNLVFAIRECDGIPVVQVGYLRRLSDFALFLNKVLADRVRVAIQTVANEVVTKTLVRAETSRRQFERAMRSIQATYGIDPATIMAHVDELETAARDQTSSPKADGAPADAPAGDEVDSAGDGLNGELPMNSVVPSL